MAANLCDFSEVEKNLSVVLEPFILNDMPVYVRNASKSFWQRNTENIVLNDLNLTVSKGKIYGLLGPSGCGKTTLLKCIIGRLSLDKGEVLTLGEKPGTPYSTIPGPRLGYMPQVQNEEKLECVLKTRRVAESLKDIFMFIYFKEDALDGIMSIKEILCYYGCLLCVPKKNIQEKITFLVNFLKLPSEKKHFSTLSGGQKRRVSFAVALIHDAELLILDEPTVGVDQILKRNIWNYLCQLVENGKKTVIITTHYIEEARRASKVGMMFEGRLLTEGEPDNLISKYRKNTLEDVFLHVCASHKVLDNGLKEQRHGQEVNTDVEVCPSSVPLLAGAQLEVQQEVLDLKTNVIQCEIPSGSNFSPGHLLNYCPDVHLSRCQAVMYRSFIQLIRFPGLLFLLLSTPTFLVSVCGFALGRPVFSIQMAVVNEDMGEAATRFLSHIDNKVIIQKNFTSWKNAEQSIANGHSWGALKFGKHFSTSLLDRYSKIQNVDRKMILNSDITVSLDGTNFVFVETIRFVLLDAFKKFISEFMTMNNLDPNLATIPIVIDDPVFSSQEVHYGNYIMPSMITSSVFFSQMGLAVISLYLDKEDGKLERIFATGVTIGEVIIGFIATQMILMVAEVFAMLFTSFVVFQFANEGSFLLIIAVIIFQGMCGTSLGLLIAGLASKFTTTTVISISLVMMAVAVGGFYWPIESSQTVVKYVSLASPVTLPANAMRYIMFRNWDLLNVEVSMCFVVTFFWTVLFLTTAIIILRAKKSH